MSDPADVVAQTWRDQSPRLVGGLLRLTRDLDLAHDLATDAMVAALEQWPVDGVPENPAAWLMTVARRRAVDHIRRSTRLAQAEIRMAEDLRAGEPWLHSLDDPAAHVDAVDDDTLRLMLLTCHPALSTESQVALTLRLVNGLTTREIARAFLVPEATVVRRITRAKATLAQVSRESRGFDERPFDLPDSKARRQRLTALLSVAYLVFTEGYAATGGEDPVRPALCSEAIRLGRLLVTSFPDDPETHGLLALMWLQHSRTPARSGGGGDLVLLADQDRERWDQLAIRRGSDALGQALAAGEPGPYTVQAAIAACHARAPDEASTDWHTVAALYDSLHAMGPSPVVQVNRAVAHSRASGPEVGLRLLEELDDGDTRQHPQLPSVRGDLLARLGRHGEAAAEFRRAAALTGNLAQQTHLLRRAETEEAG